MDKKWTESEQDVVIGCFLFTFGVILGVKSVVKSMAVSVKTKLDFVHFSTTSEIIL